MDIVNKYKQILKIIRRHFYRVFLWIFRKEIIRDTYQGILERRPDVDGFSTYSNDFKKLGIAGLTQSISQSLESWTKLNARRSEEILESIYFGITGKSPEPAILSEIVEQYKNSGSNKLDKTINNLIQSSIGWERLIDVHSDRIVTELYKAFFNRFPDEIGFQSKRAQINKNKSLELTIKGLICCEESWATFLENHKHRLISELYQGFFNRIPDSSGYKNACLSITKSQSLIDIIKAFKSSEELFDQLTKNIDSEQSILIHKAKLCFNIYKRYESREPTELEFNDFIFQNSNRLDIIAKYKRSKINDSNKKNILIFGAYGNGNLGDKYQALALSQILKENFFIDKEHIFSYSHLSSDSYPFEPSQKLSHSEFRKIDRINDFDCLIIGGGGLLAHPHYPLFDRNWIEKITIPIVFFGIGASANQHPINDFMISQASFLGARDTSSLEYIHSYNSNCCLCHDPILAHADLESLTSYDDPIEYNIRRSQTAWILKYPTSELDLKFLDFIKYICSQNQTLHKIISIEPKLDCKLEKWFPNNVVYCYNLNHLLAELRSVDRVITMRYHGAIFAYKLKLPCIGFSQVKINDFYNTFSRNNLFLNEPSDLKYLDEKFASANLYNHAAIPTISQHVVSSINKILH